MPHPEWLGNGLYSYLPSCLVRHAPQPWQRYRTTAKVALRPRRTTISARAMSQTDLISPLRFLTRLPQHLPRVPRMLRGLYYAGIRNREKNLSLAWALERAAQQHPQRPALMDESRSLSYAQFNAWANRLAWAFKAEGVRHGGVEQARCGRCPGQHHPARQGAGAQPESGETGLYADRRRTAHCLQ